MPIHDWTKVPSGIFHDFHHTWISDLSDAVNKLLSADFYALITRPERQRIADDPFVVSTSAQENEFIPGHECCNDEEAELYAAKADTIVIHRVSDHKSLARIEIVSPGIKFNQREFNIFAERTIESIETGVHLLLIDLFPPTLFAPQGLYAAIRKMRKEEDAETRKVKPLNLISYKNGTIPTAIVEPTAVNTPFVDMPIFLNEDQYIPIPLESTYQSSWKTFPEFWKQVVKSPSEAQ